MKLFNKLLLISSLAIASQADSLKQVIDNTLNNNINLKSIEIQNKSLYKSYESVQNSFNPNITIGANYLKLDGDTRAVQIGSTSTGFVKFSANLYDGGKNSAIKKQKNYEYKASQQNSITSKKEMILQVVTLYFQAKTIQENITVLEEKSKALQAQYERIKTKYEIQMTTEDEVLKLKSEYESNQYLIAELKYQKESLLQNLSLLSNSTVTSLDNSTLPTIENLIYKKSASIKALELSIQSQNEAINIISSVYYPQLKIEDNYNIYSYDDYNDKMLTDLPDQQNQLMLTLSFNLYDTSSSDKIEATKLAKIASKQKKEYLKLQEKMKFELSKKNLMTQKYKINSLNSAVKMGNSVYDMVKIKYQNGIVDNIVYLDALSKKIYNIALYKQALNDYEIAKANYFFSSGADYIKILKLLD